MSTVTINGKTYSGNNIVVSNNKVIIDGKDITPDSKQININVEGNITDLKVDCCDKISIKGNVGSTTSFSGDLFKKGDDVWVKDLEHEFPVSAVFVKYNDLEKNIFKYRVIKLGNDYESDVSFCKPKGINQKWQ